MSTDTKAWGDQVSCKCPKHNVAKELKTSSPALSLSLFPKAGTEEIGTKINKGTLSGHAS